MREIHPTIDPALSQASNKLDILCKLIREEKVLLWVGSGFSSYAGYPTGTELSSILISSINELSEGTPNSISASLQEAADYYVKRKGRSGLNSLLVEKYAKYPPCCYIHESLALINRIKYIVTTNYDLLFERAYGDKIVVVSRDEDLPGSTENPDKTILLKIHGDVTKPETIVITSNDIKKFKSDTIVWSEIRALLSKYVVLFLGYSLSDSNVEKMLKDIDIRLKGKRHPFFFISNKIDESKREHLESYNLHFIEMDVVAAINYIRENTFQYAYLDSLKNPALFSKSAHIFNMKCLRPDRTFMGEKCTQVSLTPMGPVKQSDIKITVSSKKGAKSPQILAFQKYITGESFEPVTLTESECDISIRGGEMNGILIFDPAIKKYPALSVTSQPEINFVDLQLQNTSIRMSNLEMKIFKSEILVMFEIEDPDFILKLSFRKGQQGWTLNFSLPHIASDIERGRLVYGLFGRWMMGEAIELLAERFPVPILIPSPPSSEIPPNFPPIHEINQFYTDLSDIQYILKSKITIPVEISLEEQRNIRMIASFLRGEKQKIPYIKTTIRLMTDDLSPLIAGESLTLEGPSPVGMWDFHIFGKMFEVPFRIEGSDIQFDDIETIQKLIDQGLREIEVVAKSKTGQLFAIFQPQ